MSPPTTHASVFEEGKDAAEQRGSVMAAAEGERWRKVDFLLLYVRYPCAP